ncbi:MAG: hypothetical protein HGB06_07725 [Chlorobaculum sp.]|jgi:hypothetical protein|nr:hypothetical protein [Chlorobaculum sp.]
MQENNQRVERLVAENISEVIWLRLQRLLSSQLCAIIIQKNYSSLNGEILEKKANGMSWAIRSALGYWNTKQGGLNSKILSRYYALLQISIAEQISLGDPQDDLATIQRHTEYGHGLFSLSSGDEKFPDNYYVGCLNSGHFSVYCKKIGYDLRTYCHERRPRDYSKVTKSNVYSLVDLLRRVPEFQDVVFEYLEKDPLSFHIGYAKKNYTLKAERVKEYARLAGRVLYDPPINGLSEKTYVAIYTRGASITEDLLNGYGFPIKNIVVEKPTVPGDSWSFVGEIEHPKNEYWWQHIKTYKSGYCGSSIILPFWGIDDPFLLHLTILYAFSIIVRYLPETWHKIEFGEYDNIRALLEHYLVIIDEVLPKIVVERLTKSKILVYEPV